MVFCRLLYCIADVEKASSMCIKDQTAARKLEAVFQQRTAGSVDHEEWIKLFSEKIVLPRLIK